MTFVQLEYFVAVATSGSYEEASENYHVSQSALSQQIIKLEKELDVKLFRKKGRKNELTDEGQYLLSEAQQIIDRHNNIVASLSGKRAFHISDCELHISLPVSMKGLRLEATLTEFKKKFPLCMLHLHFRPFISLTLHQPDLFEHDPEGRLG